MDYPKRRVIQPFASLHSHAIWFILLAMLGIIGIECRAGGGWSDSWTRTNSFDINRDGFADFALRTDYRGFGWWGYLASDYYFDFDPIGHTSLLGTRDAGGETIVPVSLELGTLITMVPAPSLVWTGSKEVLTTHYGYWGTGSIYEVHGLLSTNRDGAYLGVRFWASDGTHLGWVLLKPGTNENEVLAADSGFHPQPNAPIAVGEKPSWTNGSPAILSSVDIDGDNGIDFTVSQRKWTNSMTREPFWEASLQGPATSEVLCVPGEPGWPSGWYPVVLTNQTMIPPSLPSPARWLNLNQGSVSLITVGGADSQQTYPCGTLLGRSNTYVGVRFNGHSAWLLLRADGRIQGAGHVPTGPIAVGEPSPAALYHDVARVIERFDFDGDGLVDAVLREEQGGENWAWTLCLLGTNTLLSTSSSSTPILLKQGEQLRDSPIDPRSAWSRNPLGDRLWGQEVFYISDPHYGPEPQWSSLGPLGAYEPTALLGIRFHSADGTHLAWIKIVNTAKGHQLVDYGYEPTPGMELAAGMKSTMPFPSFHVQRADQYHLTLSWDRSFVGYVLEMRTAAISDSWAAADYVQTGENKVLVDIGPQRTKFFRLRKNP